MSLSHSRFRLNREHAVEPPSGSSGMRYQVATSVGGYSSCIGRTHRRPSISTMHMPKGSKVKVEQVVSTRYRMPDEPLGGAGWLHHMFSNKYALEYSSTYCHYWVTSHKIKIIWGNKSAVPVMSAKEILFKDIWWRFPQRLGGLFRINVLHKQYANNQPAGQVRQQNMRLIEAFQAVQRKKKVIVHHVSALAHRSLMPPLKLTAWNNMDFGNNLPPKPKGTHGGAWEGAGRPRNPNKVQKTQRTLGEPLWMPASQASQANQAAPTGFFAPYNTDRPIPRGASANPRTSFYSDLPSSNATTERDTASTLNALPSASHGISLQEFSQLSADLNYIEDNDEHADIAAGDRMIDDSLVDDILESTEEKTGSLEAETQATEAGKNSKLHEYLKSVKDRIVAEEAKSGKIECYSRGEFYIRPSHPIFTLRDTKDTGLKPDHLYNCKVFVWVPDQLPGCPDTFKCTCSMPLVQNVMMWQICNTSVTRFGPAPFSGLVSEIQYRHHANMKLMYLAAADFYGQSGLPPFSPFEDPAGFAGSPPSVPCIRGMLTDYISTHCIYVERDTATKPLTIASQDHTFAFLKGMGGVKGEDIFTAAFSIINENEEVQGESLTLTKSLAFVKDMFLGIQQGLRDSNNPPTQILYTDSPQEERSFHESINSALTKDVEAKLQQLCLLIPWTLKMSQAKFLLTFNPSPLNRQDAHEPHTAFVTCAKPHGVLSFLQVNVFMGQPGAPTHLDFIQIRTQNKICAFKVTDLTQRTHILPSLCALLTNLAIIKIGHSIHQSLRTISDSFSLPEIANVLTARNPPLLELGKYAKLKGMVDDPTASLHALAGLTASSELLLWEVDCQWQIYNSLRNLDSIGLPLQPAQATMDGQLVTLLQACKPVAEGFIIGNHPGYLDAIMDDTGLTKRINVLVPGAIQPLHKQTMQWIFSHGAKAVIMTSQLHTRGETVPIVTTTVPRGFALPAPNASSDCDENFTILILCPQILTQLYLNRVENTLQQLANSTCLLPSPTSSGQQIWATDGSMKPAGTGLQQTKSVTAAITGLKTLVLQIEGRNISSAQGELMALMAGILFSDPSISLPHIYTDYLNVVNAIQDARSNVNQVARLRCMHARLYYRWILSLAREKDVEVIHTKGHTDELLVPSQMNFEADHYTLTSQRYIENVPRAPVPTFFMDDYTFHTDADG
ncbi:hypothetical protein B0H19DRAFT_1055800 [Mycena capillaripes]|nr:hypothetical protein B0H19DRAFT_1055800 [Mycena capillaripes]